MGDGKTKKNFSPAAISQLAVTYFADSCGTAWGIVTRLVFPPTCRFCRVSVPDDRDFCPACERLLTVSTARMATACVGCGLPGAGVARQDEVTSEEPIRCPACQQKKNSPRFAFDQVIAVWVYQDQVCDAIVAAKFAHHAALADALGRRLGQRVWSELAGDLPDIVTPIPSFWTRRLARGGNGVSAVADCVAKRIARPSVNLLVANRAIQKQAWLSDADRVSNVHGAFSVKKSYASPRAPRIANRHILVVDDVLTTGATANEVARTLKTAGAQRVTLAVVARAVRG